MAGSEVCSHRRPRAHGRWRALSQCESGGSSRTVEMGVHLQPVALCARQRSVPTQTSSWYPLTCIAGRRLSRPCFAPAVLQEIATTAFTTPTIAYFALLARSLGELLRYRARTTMFLSDELGSASVVPQNALCGSCHFGYSIRISSTAASKALPLPDMRGSVMLVHFPMSVLARSRPIARALRTASHPLLADAVVSAGLFVAILAPALSSRVQLIS